MDRDDQRRLGGFILDVEAGRLVAERERQLRGLLARFEPTSLTMDLAQLYEFARFTYGYMRLLDVAEGRARIVDVEPATAA